MFMLKEETLAHARKERKETCCLWGWGWWVGIWISMTPTRRKISRGSWQFSKKISTLYIYSLIIIILLLISLLSLFSCWVIIFFPWSPSEGWRYIVKVDKALKTNGSTGRMRKNLWQEGSPRNNNVYKREIVRIIPNDEKSS